MREKQKPMRVELISPRKSMLARVSAAVPLVLSLVAIAISVYSAYQTRRHNRLSSTPAIEFDRIYSTKSEKIGLVMRNNGLGPGSVSMFKVFLDGEEYSTADGFADWPAISEKQEGLYLEVTPTWYRPTGRRNIRAGDELWLYQTTADKVTDIDRFRDLIVNRVGMVFMVCTVYEECHFECVQIERPECFQDN